MQLKYMKVHKYLGMTLDCYTVGQVNITMYDYIDKILDAFDKADPKSGGIKSSAAQDIILKVKKY